MHTYKAPTTLFQHRSLEFIDFSHEFYAAFTHRGPKLWYTDVKHMEQVQPIKSIAPGSLDSEEKWMNQTLYVVYLATTALAVLTNGGSGDKTHYAVQLYMMVVVLLCAMGALGSWA